MKRIQTNTIELTLMDIVDKFKLGKNTTNVRVTMTHDEGVGVVPSDATFTISFDIVKAEKAKKGGRPRKNAAGPTRPDGANGTVTTPTAAA